MSDGYNTSEHERIIAGMLRLGVITGLDLSDPEAPRCKVATGGLSSDWLPWLARRAGRTRHWSAPDIGEQVVVLAQSGDPSQGVVLPGLFSAAFPSPETDPEKDHTLFPDGTTVVHDSATNTYEVTVAGTGNWIVNCKHATVNADDDATVNTKEAKVNATTSLVVDSPTSTFKGQVFIEQLLTIMGGLAASGAGGAGSSPKAQINMDVEFINGHGITTDGGDIVAGGKSLKNHTHLEHGAGSQTSPPT